MRTYDILPAPRRSPTILARLARHHVYDQSALIAEGLDKFGSSGAWGTYSVGLINGHDLSGEAANGVRTLTPERMAQGFKSQGHLDAFYRYLDHTRICPICSRVGGVVDIGDGMQPYMDRCDRGRALDAASHG